MKSKPIHLVGNVNLDIIMRPLPEWPERGTEVVLPEQETRVGGAIGNTALALAALGAESELHACVGNDLFGNFIADELSRVGCSIRRCDEPTAYSVGIGHTGNERTFLTFPGHLASRHSAPTPDSIEGAEDGFLLLGGYFLMTGLRGTPGVELLRRAKRQGMTTLLDAGHPPEGWTDAVREELDALLPFTDYVLPNERELNGLRPDADLEQALRQLERQHCFGIVKRGRQGAALLYEGALRYVPTPTYGAIADTVGAGDVFNAGLLAGLAADLPLLRCVSLATSAASLAITTSPRRYPKWDEIAHYPETERRRS